MQVLVVGGGGREHALAWALARSPQVDRVIVAPGNAGTALEPGVDNIDCSATDIDGLLAAARELPADITVVGPEAPLVDGIVDRFEEAGLRCFGPSAAAAQLEGSKAFCKAFMARHNIPTAAYEAFSDAQAALAYVAKCLLPVVVKADGLAAGKGVVIAHTRQEAADAVHMMIEDRVFGAAGSQIVIEDFLEGEEASFIALVDGRNILPLATSQDHKARDDGDRGPNTGGMGAYSPAPVITREIAQHVMDDIMKPTVEGMRADGTRYVGFLYAGLMIDHEGRARVLEFNCRLGDPETQPLLFRLRSDLLELIKAALEERLDDADADWDERVALGVVLAAGGYPGEYRKGDVISGLPQNGSLQRKVFHAGTTLKDGQVSTTGGRVLCAVALGESVSDAQHEAYQLAGQIRWEDVYFRRDIGYRAVARERN